MNEAFTHKSEEQDTHLPTDDSMHKKKKKKRSKVAAEMGDADEISEESTDAHRKQPQEDSTEYQQISDNAFKKKKSSTTEHCEDVENSTTAMTVTEDASNEAQIMDTQTEGHEKNKKMKRSKKE